MSSYPAFPDKHSLAQRLRRIAVLALAWSWSLAATAEVPFVQIPLLIADFNDKPLDQPIGTGGAEAGEPVRVPSLMDAVVRDDAVPEKSLAISWKNHNPAAGAVRFNFLGEVDIASDIVSISLRVTPGAGGAYSVSLRESGGAAMPFATLVLTPSGLVHLTDRFSPGNPPLSGFKWSPGESYLLEWVYDMDAGTYDFSIDGIRYATDRPHGVDVGDKGLGGILVGMASSSELGSRIDVDDIVVIWWRPDEIFADGFDGLEPEPASIQ